MTKSKRFGIAAMILLLTLPTAAVHADLPEVPFVIAPEPSVVDHGDSLPPGARGADPWPGTDIDRYATIAILRERTDGTLDPALMVVDERSVGMTEEQIAAAGLPVIAREEVPSLDMSAVRDLAWPVEDVEARLHEWTGERVRVQDHPEAPIIDQHSLPIVAYADYAYQDISDWYDSLITSYEAARNTLIAEADVGIFRYYVMLGGVEVYDATNRCHLQRTAEVEAMYAPHVGVFISVFSPGDIEGHWGWAIDGPVSRQLTPVGTVGSLNQCTGSLELRRWIPSAYVMYKPLFSIGNMQMLTTHEWGHMFNMRHDDAMCSSGGAFHKHKTIEAFTDGSGKPSSCDPHADPFNHWHWDFTAPTETRLQAERTKWTTCYNAGSC